MKITFVALALEDIKLSKLHRSGRIISRINHAVTDEKYHINENMSGDELLYWYNNLDEENQTIVESISLFLQSEEQYVIKDIYNIRSQHEAGFVTERKMYQLFVGFIATLMVIITVLTNALYHLSAKHNRLVVDSNILTAFISLYENVSGHISEHGAEELIAPSEDISDGQQHEANIHDVTPLETEE